MPNIMVITAGWEQEAVIRKAREFGKVYATNPVDCLGFSYADEHEFADARDLPKLLELAKKWQVSAVVSDQCDYSLFATAYIVAVLGLKGVSLSTAQSCTNKKWMRYRCGECGILEPKYAICVDVEGMQNSCKYIGFPVIMKPVDNRGSIGVGKARDQLEAPEIFLEALANSHAREVIVEKFVEGTSIIVDGFACASGHKNLAIASRTVPAGRKPNAIEIIYPAEISDETRDEIFKLNQQVVEILGITCGATHNEYMVDKQGKVYFQEASNRGGGVLISSHIVPALTGVDVSELLVRQALGERVDIGETEMNGSALLGFFTFDDGKVKEMNVSAKNAERLEAILPKWLMFRMLVKEGDTIKKKSPVDRHGFAIFAGKDREECRSLFKQVRESIEVVYE